MIVEEVHTMAAEEISTMFAKEVATSLLRKSHPWLLWVSVHAMVVCTKVDVVIYILWPPCYRLSVPCQPQLQS